MVDSRAIYVITWSARCRRLAKNMSVFKHSFSHWSIQRFDSNPDRKAELNQKNIQSKIYINQKLQLHFCSLLVALCNYMTQGQGV